MPHSLSALVADLLEVLAVLGPEAQVGVLDAASTMRMDKMSQSSSSEGDTVSTISASRTEKMSLSSVSMHKRLANLMHHCLFIVAKHMGAAVFNSGSALPTAKARMPQPSAPRVRSVMPNYRAWL